MRTSYCTGDTESVQVENLTVRFGDFPAVQDVTSTFEPGTATAVMGMNGSGKTTLLEAMAGLKPITTGTVHGLPKNIAYVRQCLSNNWMPITVKEVIAMGRYNDRGLTGWLRQADHRAIHEAAERLSVDELLGCSFSILSGGQRQRVRLAQALVTQPQLLMLDEAITGLDIPSQSLIVEVIDECVQCGMIVVLTTHHLQEARRCDRVMLLANQVMGQGSAEEMLVPEQLSVVFGNVLACNVEEHQHEQEEYMVDYEDGHPGCQ